MKPLTDYNSPDDRPLNTYLSPVDAESIDYISDRNTQVDGEFDEGLDIDLASLMGMSDTDLLKHVLPDSLGDEEPRMFELGFECQITAVEDRIQPIRQEVAEPTSTPTLHPEIVDNRLTVKTKRPGQGRRKQPIKRQRRPRPRNRGNRSIHLWEFLKEMLNNSEENKSYIKWISKREGIFQLVNSSGVAKLWGQRKNRNNMTYEKMSRALRYYYEKDILERVPNARLIYKFGGKTRLIATENGDDSLSDTSEN